MSERLYENSGDGGRSQAIIPFSTFTPSAQHGTEELNLPPPLGHVHRCLHGTQPSCIGNATVARRNGKQTLWDARVRLGARVKHCRWAWLKGVPKLTNLFIGGNNFTKLPSTLGDLAELQRARRSDLRCTLWRAADGCIGQSAWDTQASTSNLCHSTGKTKKQSRSRSRSLRLLHLAGCMLRVASRLLHTLGERRRIVGCTAVRCSGLQEPWPLDP